MATLTPPAPLTKRITNQPHRAEAAVPLEAHSLEYLWPASGGRPSLNLAHVFSIQDWASASLSQLCSDFTLEKSRPFG